ncbi:lipocalin-like domain-containing protein [Ferruginibacter sp.]|nr:DUF4923 family protein [Ferruginibacter sp.]
MKKLQYILFAAVILTCFISCQNKTKNYIVKKWDCVQIENLTPIDKNYITKEDSAVAIKMEAALKALSWSFNKDNTYQCSIGDKITTQGTYEISVDEKIITLTSSTKNNINTYIITSISAIEMTLTSAAATVPIIMHFRPN